MSRGSSCGINVRGVTVDRGHPARKHTPHYKRWQLEEALEHRSLTRRERRALERLTKPRRRSA
jgi:hypothetical protein